MTTQVEDRIAPLEAENQRLDASLAATKPIDELAERIAQLEKEKNRLDDALQAATALSLGQENPKVRPTYGYYRQPNGWITLSPAMNTDELRYRRNGWTPLRQYGNVEMTTPYMANHPLEPLFMQGGAFELPEDQIREQGLYMNPQLIPTCRTPLNQDHKHHEYACMERAKPVVFPQLARMKDLGPFKCTICDRVLPTIESREQHTNVMRPNVH